MNNYQWSEPQTGTF